MNKKYRIICLKRSNFERMDDEMFLSDWYEKSHIVYWKDDYSGYTNNIEKAGLYDLEDLKFVCGRFMDYLIEPAWK